jgi:hypothetical protein
MQTRGKGKIIATNFSGLLQVAELQTKIILMKRDFEQAERYQELFNLMSKEHGLTLTMTEMDDIISEVEKLQQSSIFGVVQAKPEGFYCEDEQGRIAEETGDKIEKCGKQCYYCKQ